MTIIQAISNGLGIVTVLEKKYQKGMAIAYALLSASIMTIMYVCVNILHHEYTPIQIVNYRMIFGLVINSIICFSQKVKVYTQEQPLLFKLLVFRGLLGGVGMFTIFTCISNMKLSDGVVIVNTNPIWTNILAACFLGEQFNKRRLVFCFISFIGILVVSRPSFLFEQVSSNQEQDKNELFGLFFGIVGSIVIAIVTILLRKLSHDLKCPSSVQMQYNFFLSSLTSSLFFMLTYSSDIIITAKFVGVMIILSMCGVLGQLFLTKAMGLEKASVIAPLQYTQVIFSFLVDIFVLKVDILLSSVIGVSLILAGSLGVLF